MMKIVPVDFETEAIEQRPVYPPKPVGVALEINGKPKYLAWGHPTENNCTKKEATRILKDVYRNNIIVYHHAAFDISVGCSHMGLQPPKKFEDTLFLAYLFDPRELDLGLKPLADKYLDMPPEERDRLKEWILKHVYEAQGIKETKKNPWGAHIAEAPGKLVGKYAVGDIVRTKRLFNYYHPKVMGKGMREAYEREIACMPIFEDMSTTGLGVHKALKRDVRKWEEQHGQWALGIAKRLKLGKVSVEEADKVLGSSKQLAEALDKAGKIDVWFKTDKGNRSTARDNLVKGCNDKKLVATLSDYGILSTLISTFGRPWVESAERYNGRVYPSFNQVRSTDDQGKSRGTRTGRPSSNNPNFLNVPRNQERDNLPWMRNYIIPDEGCSFLIRDYSQQELRILAHYEEGILYRYFLDDPRLKGEKDEKKWADAHTLVSDLITQAVHHTYPRKHVKIVNFGVVYGMGREGTANKIEGSMQEATDLLAAHKKALPGVKELSRDIQKWAKKGNPIYTWGGREYFAEEPKMIRGQKRDFYYKLLNYLIQGSAADCTKEAMIRADEALKIVDGRLALQVYDELVACVPKGQEKRGMKLLKEAMESIEFDVPMLTDGKIGKLSWGKATKYKD